MDAEQLKKLSDILYFESKAEAVKLIQSINSEDELFVLLDIITGIMILKCQRQLLLIRNVLFLLPY